MSLHHAMRSAVNTLNADPDFKNVSLLLLGNGTNGGQNNTFVDDSSNAFSITRYGNTTQGTFSPFGYNWGVNTGDGSYPTCSYTAFNSVSGDFTIECWAFIQDAGRSIDSSKYGNFFAGGATGSASNIWAFTFLISGGVITQLILQADNSDRISLTGLSISINAWHHFAMVRSGSTITIYVDGASAGSGTYSGTINSGSTGRTVIGQGSYGGSYANYLKGTISNVRFVVGTAVYTANFTPATTNLTAITNTTLLTCQDNRFKDNSSNAFAISVTGSPSVTNFAPFPTNSEYSTGTNGGSGYFDGSGDYLEIAANSAIQFGTGDYTIEFWVYPLQSGRQDMIDMPGTNRLQVAYEGTNTAIYINQTFIAGSAVAPTVNAWNHIAATRSGTNTRVFLNGTQLGSTATNSTNFSDNSLKIVDTTSGTTPLKGYMAGVRVVKGGALYTAGYTVPTSPPTTTVSSGTVGALLNFTNAAIIDSTGKNNLETVGDAQISTSTQKYGTGSLKFDGTGDFLSAPNGSQFDFGTGDFTVEFWVNFTSTSSVMSIVSNYFSSTVGWTIQRRSDNGTLTFAYGDTVIYSQSWSPSTSTWYHIAATRSGTSLRVFVDGTQLGSTVTNSTSLNGSTSPLVVGGLYVGGYLQPLNGYVDDLRITKGVARYTANFTPPTRQLPAR